MIGTNTVSTALTAACLLLVAPAYGAWTLGQRLEALAQAIVTNAGSFVDKPAAHARVAWTHLDGDAGPDAVVIVKKDASDCAVHYDAKTAPCMGYLFRSDGEGNFTPLTAFPYFGQPISFGPQGKQGRALYFADRNALDVPYDKYLLRDGKYQLVARGLAKDAVLEESVMVVSDRTIDKLSDQVYAARSFPETGSALLAPARVHVDAINATQFAIAPKANLTKEGQLRKREALTRAGKILFPLAVKDATTVAAHVGWSQQLNVRLWVCGDWVVPRRFWEVEQDGLADVGVCLEPFTLWAKGVWQRDPDVPEERASLAMRVRLYQEMGIALLLRGEFLSAKQVGALKLASNARSDATEATVVLGSAIGALLGAQYGGLSNAVFIAAHDDWMVLANNWFAEVERDIAGYPAHTPELAAFVLDLRHRVLGAACAAQVELDARNVTAPSEAKPKNVPECPKAYLQNVQGIASQIRTRWP